MKRFRKIVLFALISAMCLSLLTFSAMAAGEIAWGGATVNASILNIRSGPGLDNKIIGKIPDGEKVVILEKTSAEWYKINYQGTIGYVSVEYLTDVLTAKNFEATGRVNSDSVRLRKGHSTSTEILNKYNTGDELQVIGINTGWYKIKDGDLVGYIRSDLMDIVGPKAAPAETPENPGPGLSDPNEKPEDPDTPPSQPEKPTTTEQTLGEKIAAYALKYKGYKYVYGEESPEKGFDCSGLTWYVYRHFGYNICRTASTQYANNGKAVKKSQLQPGDLVFFSSNGKTVSHVGMYIGDGKFIHASTPTKGVVVSDLSSDYYVAHYVGARRIIES